MNLSIQQENALRSGKAFAEHAGQKSIPLRVQRINEELYPVGGIPVPCA
jgi:hypothetical protein